MQNAGVAREKKTSRVETLRLCLYGDVDTGFCFIRSHYLSVTVSRFSLSATLKLRPDELATSANRGWDPTRTGASRHSCNAKDESESSE